MQHSIRTASAPPLDNLSVTFIIERDNARLPELGHNRHMLKMSQIQIAEMETKLYCNLNNRSQNYTDREVITRPDSATILEKAHLHALMTSICKDGVEIVGGAAA